MSGAIPVEPPSAGFILQLFIVPGVIVAVVVDDLADVQLAAQLGNDRDAFVWCCANDEARWQAAFNLAMRSRRTWIETTAADRRSATGRRFGGHLIM